MDVVARLHEMGFARVVALRGESCGIREKTLLLAIMTYEAELEPAEDGAWIHPYYFASQRAYQAAVALAKEAQAAGVPLKLRDEVRVKPIFARLPGMTQGRNTLSYLPGIGSRFHVQIFALDEELDYTAKLEKEPHALHCGDCRRCLQSCPTGALDEHGFHREKCVRNWQLGGRKVPQEVRSAMGNSLIGCDICQRVCPHNPPPQGESQGSMSMERLLGQPKEAAGELRERIGANLALPNRVLAQSCLLAGCLGKDAYVPLLEKLEGHPSPVVAAHAAWAKKRLLGLDEKA